ncbi:MAG: hypothetical protein OXB88_02280 [Bacteriovoracales bacterium]|nr:hypothetical protein [Bacteriovoracales bacterium]
MFLEKVIGQFEKYRIPYALVGGHAVALHGAVRGTIDLDFIITWSLRNLQLVESALSEIGLVPRLPITPEDLFNFKQEYIDNKNLIAWSFVNPDHPVEMVDIVITWNLKKNMIDRMKLKTRRINVLAKKHLIAMKKSSTREQDSIDARILEQLDET